MPRFFTYTLGGVADRYDEGNPLNVQPYEPALAAVRAAGAANVVEGFVADQLPSPVIDPNALLELAENLPLLRENPRWKAKGGGRP